MLYYNTLFVGNVVHHFDQLSSTNEHAFDLLAKSEPSEGTVISTYDQTAGRGQIGRSWASTPGQNLTFSLILYPRQLPVRQQFLLSQAISLAVADTVAHYLPTHDVAVKWPNDIYLDRRKVAGILIQNSLQGQQIRAAVVGIGLNVNQTVFPASVPNATSLAQASASTYILEEVRGQLFQHLEQRYLALRGGAHATLQQHYLDRLLDYQVQHTYQRATGERFVGRITGIDAQGRLVIRHGQGEEHFSLGEVSRIAD